MVLPTGVVSGPFHVGAKGRVVLPANVRRAAGIGEGAELVARQVGEGQVLLETKEAVRARVWGAAPEPTDADITADVRAMRAEDVAIGDRNAVRRATLIGSDADSEAVGADLLAQLGL